MRIAIKNVDDVNKDGKIKWKKKLLFEEIWIVNDIVIMSYAKVTHAMNVSSSD